ncbi:DNA-processing protein DprA, partial [bacterium]|nr:DNA-processing protein DprA [bacterium]
RVGKDTKLITPSSPEYPEQLLDLDDPPLVLYTKGQGNLQFSNGISIVGSRCANNYGISVALDLSANLAKIGLPIISGLARGIDTCAHKGALEAKGFTVAVLGCGINFCYPSENKRLWHAILDRGGMIISEYPDKTQPLPYHFPYRNRVIAALSRATVVVQASLNSGAMITADLTSQLGRQVMAVPGPINHRQSEGTLELISNGATLVRTSKDVLDGLGIILTDKQIKRLQNSPPINETERKILFFLKDKDGSDTESILEELSLPPGEVISILTTLELKGLIRRLPNLLWVLKDRQKMQCNVVNYQSLTANRRAEYSRVCGLSASE